MTTDIWILQK